VVAFHQFVKLFPTIPLQLFPFLPKSYLAAMYKLFIAVLLVTGFSACVFTTKRERPVKDETHEKALDEMVETDRRFSESCAQLGMRKAFLEFVADDAVLLRPGYMPIVEGDVIKFLSSQEDSSFVMTWRPTGWKLSKSNDLGYTYGEYEVRLKANDSTFNGTYLSIWQKQTDGKWKFVLDTGNQGVDNIVQ
jgi:ketosteroid isomerase-like protein